MAFLGVSSGVFLIGFILQILGLAGLILPAQPVVRGVTTPIV
jgi:hypothetical protein